jgi:hypothetical protein
VRQLAAALKPHLTGIAWIDRAFKKGASKLAHSKGFASGKPFGIGRETVTPGATLRLYKR